MMFQNLTTFFVVYKLSAVENQFKELVSNDESFVCYYKILHKE